MMQTPHWTILRRLVMRRSQTYTFVLQEIGSNIQIYHDFDDCGITMDLVFEDLGEVWKHTEKHRK